MTYCNHSNQKKYPFILPELPYGKEEFKPHFTAETFDYHYNKHHNAYVTNLNNLLQDNKEMIDMDLESIILASNNSNAPIFNNAAQVWNHSFFWHSIKPNGGGKPKGEILSQIEKDFGSYDAWINDFKACGLVARGWVVLAWDMNDGRLHNYICDAHNQGGIWGAIPVIVLDTYEHAYMLDFGSDRKAYIENFCQQLNWNEANKVWTKVQN